MAEGGEGTITRVRSKNPERKREYQESHHTLRLRTEIWERWQQNKSKHRFKTHDELATALMNLWESKHDQQSLDEEWHEVMQTEGEKTPEKITSVAKPTISTPLEDQPPVLSMLPDVSDISEGSESDIDIMERYMKRAKEADNSFIEISLDYGTEDDKDSTYIPETSDEEESCDDDLSEYEDFDLDMSLLLENTMQNLEEVPIQGSEERESYVESDESDYEVESDEEDSSDYERNVVTERKIICFEENIKQLAQMLRVQCTTRNCTSAVSIQQSLKGTAMELKWVCNQGHTAKKWSSQPVIKRRMAGDFLLSTCILTSGNNYDKIKLMFRFFGMGITARSTHYQIQGKHSVPVISEQFSDMVQRNRLKYAGQTITIAGDGRMDSPGHSAQYCTYTMLEYQSKDIISMEIVEKRMTALKSTRMEIEGLKRAIIGIQEANISVGEVVTDASTTIAAMLRKDHPKVTHSFDTWHGAKNFGKRIGTVAAEKKNKDLRPWVSDLVNHFWFCSRCASGDESKLLSSWRGILHHVVNVHQWGLGDGAGQAQCQHGDLDDHVEPKWLEPGSDAHHSLTRVILDTGLLHSLKHYVNFRHTGELENFHDALLMYCAKRYAYSYPVYKARNMLAALDYQFHKDRPKLVNKKGESRLRRVWSKRSANWTAYEVKEPKKYDYMNELLQRIIEHFTESDMPLSAKMEMSPSDPRRVKRTLAEVSPPSTKQLFAEKKSRFEPDK